MIFYTFFVTDKLPLYYFLITSGLCDPVSIDSKFFANAYELYASYASFLWPKAYQHKYRLFNLLSVSSTWIETPSSSSSRIGSSSFSWFDNLITLLVCIIYGFSVLVNIHCLRWIGLSLLLKDYSVSKQHPTEVPKQYFS